MEVAPGADVVATLAAPGGLDLGARIEVPDTRAIASYWRRATYDPVAGVWTVTLEHPVTPQPADPELPRLPRRTGFLLVWRTGDAEPPEYETSVPLEIA